MSRIPPSASRSGYRDPIAVLAFEKNPGTVSSTFIGRLIRRVPVLLQLREGGTMDVVRYAGRYWPIYPPETFKEKSAQWVSEDDTLLGDDHFKLKLPLKHAYLFECDKPRGHYDL